MRIFQSATELYEETFRELFKRGQTVFDKTVQGKKVDIKDYEQKEIISYNYRIDNFNDLDDMMAKAKEKFKKEHLTSHAAEVWFKDMVENTSLTEKWWFEFDSMEQYFMKFCNEGTKKKPKAAYGYGERIVPKVNKLISRLQNNIYSRGSVINIFESKDLGRRGRRIPCTLSYHFLCRNTLDGNKLNLIIHQRSCDMINFFPLDLYKAYLLLDYVAKKLNVKIGYIVHNIDSAHAYKCDIPQEYRW